MKLLWLMFLFLCSNSFANQLGFLPDNYFRPMGAQNWHKVVGASVDPITPGNSSFVTELAMWTHNPKDGCLLPSLVCETWSPLMIGPSYNAGKFAVVAGPVVNLAPKAKAGLRAVVNQFPDKWLWKQGTLDLLSQPDNGLTISFGPQLYLNPLRGGTFMPVNAWQPAGRIFAGLELTFN